MHGFVLVGGSALALRIQHRLSEDLDLVWLEPRLPRARIEALMRVASAAGFNFEPQDDEATLQEFADTGLELRDYEQNYLVNHKVKVSFFALEPAMAKVLQAPPEALARVATLAELLHVLGPWASEPTTVSAFRAVAVGWGKTV